MKINEILENIDKHRKKIEIAMQKGNDADVLNQLLSLYAFLAGELAMCLEIDHNKHNVRKL